MTELYLKSCLGSSRLITRSYSTSFSLGILSLAKRYRDPIYAIYGFVRFADEIVDSFHDHDKESLLDRFEKETWSAIAEGISLNPVLHSFQYAVNTYHIPHELIEQFLHSMRMDLRPLDYNPDTFKEYILGSAEVVGLMCLCVFCEGNTSMYEKLKPQAMALGSAFQKINFLRDLKADVYSLGRAYFPGFDPERFDEKMKQEIEADIDHDFHQGLEGIRQLPYGSRFGVYVAYVYYYNLFKKIRNLPASRILSERVRIPNRKKYGLIVSSYFRHAFNLL
jgi:phytoene synthase